MLQVCCSTHSYVVVGVLPGGCCAPDGGWKGRVTKHFDDMMMTILTRRTPSTCFRAPAVPAGPRDALCGVRHFVVVRGAPAVSGWYRGWEGGLEGKQAVPTCWLAPCKRQALRCSAPAV